MQWTIVGLGNPGGEYTGTRHNSGRDFLVHISTQHTKDSPLVWKEDAKLHARIAKGVLFGTKVTLVLPDTYMNKSGAALQSLIKTKKAAEQLVVLHDELDLPLGRVKISFGSSSGGHRGVDSIQKILKTKDFIRIRIGISPATPSGKLKKPDASDTNDFVLGTYKPAEQEKLKKVQKMVAEALQLILTEGREHATMVVHSKQ